MCDPGTAVETTVENNEAQGQGAPEAEPARACRACGNAMVEGQDWCLQCGTAAPGRLGRRPGGRTASSIAALTLVLVVGAVAAAYAALSGDANTQAAKTATGSAAPIPGAVAQVPDAPAPTTTAPATPTTPATTPKAPKTPETPATPSVPPTPVTPVVPVTPPASTPTTQTAPTTTSDTTTDTTPTTPAKPVTLTKIDLGADALSLYEPSKRSTRSGDPADAQDGDKTTAWYVTTPDDGYPMQVGLLIDLEKVRNVKEIDLGTTTPGGRVEVYGAAGSALPPDILDTRWEHVASQSKVDDLTADGNVKDDGVEKIRLPGPGATGSRFRRVLLWFTTPPTKGPTVRVTEVTLKG